MDERSYHTMQNQYRKREDLSSLSYNGRKNHTYRPESEEQPIPYAIRFRLRMVVCIVLFLSFLFANSYILKENETQVFYQKLEENTSLDDWKNYAVTAFDEIKEIKNY